MGYYVSYEQYLQFRQERKSKNPFLSKIKKKKFRSVKFFIVTQVISTAYQTKRKSLSNVTYYLLSSFDKGRPIKVVCPVDK